MMSAPTTAPEWLPFLKARIDDYVSDTFRPEFDRRWDSIADDLHRLTPEAGDRARDRTLIAALEITEPHDAAGVVRPVIDLLQRRIEGEDVAVEMARARIVSAQAIWRATRRVTTVAALVAAEAAEMAARTTWAVDAARAAWAADVAAAETEATARAARVAVTRAAQAAGPQAWDTVAVALLATLEQELNKGEDQ